MNQVFQSRLEDTGIQSIANMLQIEHPEAEAMVAADGVVAKRLSELDKEMFTPFYAKDLVELGRKVAAGELKPKTVADRVASVATKPGRDGWSRRDHILVGVRQGLVAAEDRPEWSKKNLLKSFVPVVQERIEGYISELQAALADAPAHVREPIVNELSACLGTGHVDLQSLSASDFAAYKRIKDALSISEITGNEGQVTYPFQFTGGTDMERVALILGGISDDRFTYRGELKAGAHPGFKSDLLWTDDVELLAAGVSLDKGLKGRYEITFAPIVDPAGVHAEVYADRLERFNKVQSWRFEYSHMRAEKASVPRGRYEQLRRRYELAPEEVLAEMKKEGLL